MTAGLMYFDSFLGYRTGGWHHMGYTSQEELLALPAYNKVGPWPVQKVPLFSIKDHQDFIESGASHPILEPTPVYGIIMMPNRETRKSKFIATVTNRYHFFPYEKALQIADEEIGKHIDTIGLLDDGMLFCTWNLPDIAVHGDQNLRRLVISVPIDGKTAFRAFEATERVVCRNTYNLALGQATDMLRAPHDSRIEEAFRKWCRGMYSRYMESTAVKEVMEILVAHRVRPGEGQEVVSWVYPEPVRIDAEILDNLPKEEAEKRIEAWEVKRDFAVALQNEVKALYAGKGRGLYENPETAGTAYELFQAVVELENYRKGRGGERAVATSVVFGDRAATIQRAFDGCLSISRN
jgi:hypothetical protein